MSNLKGASCKNRVLAVSMRPSSLKDMIGQEELTNSLSSQLSSGRTPHFFIISGQIGSGKTTLATILSMCLQLRKSDVTEKDWKGCNKLDIHEMNAANTNGIDDMRKLVERMAFKPLPPSRAKVVILDEAHQLTTPAQNMLLTVTEKPPEDVYYIFCTSTINKIIPALRRRASIYTTKPLELTAISQLVEAAREQVHYAGETESLLKCLEMNVVDSPGLILQAAERFFSGIPADAAVLVSAASTKHDTMSLCRAVASGDWSGCCTHLTGVTKADVYGLRCSVLGYLKAVLIKSNKERALALSKAIGHLVSCSTDDSTCLPSFMSGVCLACNVISERPTPQTTKAKNSEKKPPKAATKAGPPPKTKA